MFFHALNILTNIPHLLRGRWYTVSKIAEYLQHGGAHSITKQHICSAICRDNQTIFNKVKYLNSAYYCYGYCGPNTPADHSDRRKEKIPKRFLEKIGKK